MREISGRTWLVVALLDFTSAPHLSTEFHIPPMDSAAFSKWWGDSAKAGKGSQTCAPLLDFRCPGWTERQRQRSG